MYIVRMDIFSDDDDDDFDGVINVYELLTWLLLPPLLL